MINQELLSLLTPITDEEQAILGGQTDIDQSLYSRVKSPDAKTGEIDSSVVLGNGKLIDIRPHTRFVHFPKHTHNYVEFVYMCQGTTTHIIDNDPIILKEGDLLFMNQHAAQEILPAGKEDIAVNFMILPVFFDEVLRMMAPEKNMLRDFIVNCLTRKDAGSHYLYFDMERVLPIRNLMENLIWIMLKSPSYSRTLSQTTMALFFMNLMDHADRIHAAEHSWEEELTIRLLNYIETKYPEATLGAFADDVGVDIYTLSRLIKKQTGRTFKELLIDRRLRQADFLLVHTTLAVTEIAVAVGYENTSYFHRTFRTRFGMSPKEYRKQNESRVVHAIRR